MITRYQMLTWPKHDDQAAEVDDTLHDTVEAAIVAHYGELQATHWEACDDGGVTTAQWVLELAGRRNMACVRPVSVPENDSERITLTADILLDLGQTDGEHHKMWVIDQALRMLLGDLYFDAIARHCAGDDGPETYEWDHGIAP